MIRKHLQALRFSPTLKINELVRAKRAAGRTVYHLGFGQSPFGAHPAIREALAANADKVMYLPVAGLESLRERALAYFADKLHFDADGFDVTVGSGSKQLIFDAQSAVQGDLLMPVPSWVSYGPQAALLQDNVVRVFTRKEDLYHVTPDGLETAIREARNKGLNPAKLVLNYPNNPSGLELNAERLRELADVCRKHGLVVISDEIYALVNYAGDHQSIARYYPEGTVVTTGLSKHLSLGGYRLGLAFVPKAATGLSKAMRTIGSATWSCVSSPAQYAALRAVEDDPELELYVQDCTRVHGLVSRYACTQLNTLGLAYPEPQGAFYLYPNMTARAPALEQAHGVRTSEELATDLLERTSVATLPGTAFGDRPQTLALRIAMCDYDGDQALAGLRADRAMAAADFVARYCPHVAEGVRRLVEYVGG